MQDGNTALMRAALGGYLDVVDLLLNQGADANMQSAQGGTALMQACYRGHADVVRRLLDAKASTRLQDAYDGTALMRAADGGHKDVVEILLELSDPADREFFLDAKHKYDGYTALMRAASKGHIECVRVLAKYGASMRIRNVAGKNVKNVAREAGKREIVNVLMELETFRE